eukprot:6954523-Alexandrium_andersonii.AAC.1
MPRAHREAASGSFRCVFLCGNVHAFESAAERLRPARERLKRCPADRRFACSGTLAHLSTLSDAFRR